MPSKYINRMGKHAKITISLPSETVETAKAFCANTGRTLSGYIRRCLEKEMEKEEKDATQSS